MKNNYTLEDILNKKCFLERIEIDGNQDDFKDWWLSTIYHKIPFHEEEKVEKIISRYERFSKNNAKFNQLNKIVEDIHFPEMYSPERDEYYIFLPDARQDAKYRLTVMGSDGTMKTHHPFDNREDAIKRAAKEGCTEIRNGSLDRLTTLEGHKRSIVKYEAICQNLTLDQYLSKTKDIETIKLFAEDIKRIKRASKEKRREDASFTM